MNYIIFICLFINFLNSDSYHFYSQYLNFSRYLFLIVKKFMETYWFFFANEEHKNISLHYLLRLVSVSLISPLLK